MNVSLDLYKVFYCVAKNKNITRASEELMISQPAVSKSIKTLEEQLGAELLERNSSGVELTELGNMIYEKIENALLLIDSAEGDIKSVLNMEEGTLSIGTSKTIINEFLMPYIVAFNNSYPNIKIKIFTDTASLIKKYQLGLIDIVFINMPTDNIPVDCELVKLMEFNNCFVANDKYIEYKDKKLEPKDLEKLPLLLLNEGTINRKRIDDYCYNHSIKIKPKMEFGSNTLIKDFAVNGFGIGMLDEENVKDEIENNKLFKLDIDIKLSEKYLAMFYNTNMKKLSLKKFIKIIKDNDL